MEDPKERMLSIQNKTGKYVNPWRLGQQALSFQGYKTEDIPALRRKLNTSPEP